jgi:hypothetical protein
VEWERAPRRHTFLTALVQGGHHIHHGGANARWFVREGVRCGVAQCVCVWCCVVCVGVFGGNQKRSGQVDTLIRVIMAAVVGAVGATDAGAAPAEAVAKSDQPQSDECECYFLLALFPRCATTLRCVFFFRARCSACETAWEAPLTHIASVRTSEHKWPAMQERCLLRRTLHRMGVRLARWCR